ncbi:uncharacterized protein GIQ15_01409 [Arthroderma uncinatum]|uniref:uncharacterized protein n=1 Tax=Arthroderma uncinatum TaxID=74035 RepID=UPI00144A8F04|nr:uncharacterized protein GIQ15_01409 [Arthroderma uncinatum]KAF3491892.1 hypothetical protein GIQ15_01409 [Arthroderma uncinatum]
MTLHDESSQELEEIPRETWTWSAVESLPKLTGPTVLNLIRIHYISSPTTILKFGACPSEGIMTVLARSIVGPSVPHVDCIITVPPKQPHLESWDGIVMSRQPGMPLIEVWPSLSPSQRRTIKEEICQMIVRMRKRQFSYYGRPGRKPYVLFGSYRKEEHPFCASRSEWDDSRIKAMRASEDLELDRVPSLEKIQRDTTGPDGWDRPVLTHGDISDRNILVDPQTLAVTGFLDWEVSNIMPAYFDYVNARLSGGHDPGWRVELLDIMRSVLRRECNAVNADKGEELYNKTLAAWDEIVKIERFAQQYSDDCYWTFETGLPASEKTDSAL